MTARTDSRSEIVVRLAKVGRLFHIQSHFSVTGRTFNADVTKVRNRNGYLFFHGNPFSFGLHSAHSYASLGVPRSEI